MEVQTSLCDPGADVPRTEDAGSIQRVEDAGSIQRAADAGSIRVSDASAVRAPTAPLDSGVPRVPTAPLDAGSVSPERRPSIALDAAVAMPVGWPAGQGFAGAPPASWFAPRCLHDQRGNWVCLVQSDAVWNPDSCAFGPAGELITAHQLLWSAMDASLLLTRFERDGAVAFQRVWNRGGGWPTHTLEALGLGVHPDGRISWAGRDCLRDPAAPAAANPGYYAGSCINAHVATLSAQGELLWELPFGTRDGGDQITDLALAPDGGLYLGGMFQAPLVLPGLTPPESHGGIDFFVLALDREGRPRWVRTFGSPEHEGDGVRIAANAQGELGVHGNFTQKPTGGFTALLDAQGEARWQVDVPEHSVGHMLFDGPTLLLAAGNALLAFDAHGDMQRRALPGTSWGAHLAHGAGDSLIVYTPGAGLIEAAPSGVVRRRLDLHDWIEPWYYSSMCTGPGGVIGVVGTVRDPTDFGFLDAPVADARGASFVLHLAEWGTRESPQP